LSIVYCLLSIVYCLLSIVYYCYLFSPRPSAIEPLPVDRLYYGNTCRLCQLRTHKSHRSCRSRFLLYKVCDFHPRYPLLCIHIPVQPSKDATPSTPPHTNTTQTFYISRWTLSLLLSLPSMSIVSQPLSTTKGETRTLGSLGCLVPSLEWLIILMQAE
jgi:hypothetical protein